MNQNQRGQVFTFALWPWLFRWSIRAGRTQSNWRRSPWVRTPYGLASRWEASSNLIL